MYQRVYFVYLVSLATLVTALQYEESERQKKRGGYNKGESSRPGAVLEGRPRSLAGRPNIDSVRYHTEVRPRGHGSSFKA